MEEHKIRFPRTVWELAQREAALNGETAGEFVRIATLSRAAYSAAKRDAALGQYDEINDVAKRMLRRYTPDEV